MGIFLVYILKSAACLAVFYLFYKLLMSRDTFHRFNRFALLGLLVLSSVLPLVEVSVNEPVGVQETMLTLEQLLLLADVEEGQETVVAQPATALWVRVALLVYLAGIVFFAVRNLWSLGRLGALLRRGRLERVSDYLPGRAEHVRLVVHDRDIAPFSWMRYIVLSRKDLEENGREILIHELAHIRNRHSWDLLLADLCIFVQWFNPAAWLLKQELQTLHEYEADETVLREGVDARKYQMLLIKKAVGTRLYSMANSFNHSKLKKRITMMLKEKSSPWARMKYLYVLPVAAITLTAFARPEISNELNEISTIKVNDITSILDAKEVNNFLLIADTTQKVEVKTSMTIFEEVEESRPSTPRYTKIKVKKDTTNLKEYQISITKAIDVATDTSLLTQAILAAPSLFIVNGHEVSVDSVKMINPNKIETVTILKDKYASILYGNKGKDGVVSITYTSGSPDKKVTSYKLADGTTVYLESETSTTGSYAIIHSKDTSSLRTVKLKGEARFKIVEKDSIIEYQVTSDTLKYGIQKKKEK